MWILGVELASLVATLVLAVLWIKYPSSTYQPWIVLAGLVLAASELARRFVQREKSKVWKLQEQFEESLPGGAMSMALEPYFKQLRLTRPQNWIMCRRRRKAELEIRKRLNGAKAIFLMPDEVFEHYARECIKRKKLLHPDVWLCITSNAVEKACPKVGEYRLKRIFDAAKQPARLSG